jgi:transcriptional regulator with XRE-family HTH domain
MKVMLSGVKIKEYRVLNNYTIDEIATLLNITPVKMERIEEGSVFADVKMYVTLADFYKIKIGDLFKIR